MTHKYEAFLKIVEIGNITKAAAALGYSQSAISHLVSTLESEWNLKLLIRDRQGVRLTREGETLLPAMKRIVEENKALFQQVSHLQTLEEGVIHIASFQSAMIHLLPKLMASFSAIYPKIEFKTRMADYSHVEQMILDGKTDCGFVPLPVTQPIDAIPLFRDRLLAIFPEGAHADRERFSIEELEHAPFIRIDNDVDYEVQQLLKKYNIRPGKTAERKLVSGDDFSTVSMVANGLGMCIVPELVLEGHNFRLRTLELDPPAWRTICIAYNKERLSPATRKFIDHAKETLADEFAQSEKQ